MLYLPWRDENTDLINVNHYQKFVQNFETVQENKKFFVFSNDLEEHLFQALFVENNGMVQMDDNCTNIQSSSQNEFRVFGAEHAAGDIFIDIGENQASSENKNTENNRCDDVYFPVPFVMNDIQYRQIVTSLNVKQRTFLLHVLHAFKSDELPIYNCVFGGAGVGKSCLIAAVHQSLIRYFNSKPDTSLDLIRVLLCAFPGKVAHHIKGITLHTAFILPVTQFSGALPSLSNATLSTLRCKLRDLRVIIVDEISLVGSRLLDQVDARLKQIFGTDLPFGGKSVLVLGDFNQLGPVGDKYIFKGNSSNPYSLLVGNPLWDLFHSFELTEIMRQKDDAVFANALNNLANGSLSDEEVKLFQSRETQARNIPSDAINLFRNNANVDSFNENVIKKSKADIVIAVSSDTVTGQGTEKLVDRALSAVKNLPARKTEGLPTILKLVLKIKYMVTVNVCIPDGLVNGAIGTLEHVEKNEEGAPTRLWIDFGDSEVGKAARQAVQWRPPEVLNNLTPLEKQARRIHPLPNAIISVVRKQFPLVPAEAITICKSQGATYSKVAVYIISGLKRNELYVACSRCTSLSGLFIVGTFRPPSAPGPYDEVQLAIKSLRRKKIKFSCLFANNFPRNRIILYHNVQSLNAHFQDIKNDLNYQCSNILISAESWLKPTDFPEYPNFYVVGRQDVYRNVAHAHGVIVYAKLNEECNIIFESSSEEKGTAHNLFVLVYEDYAICTGYIPPSTSFSVVQLHFKEMLTSGFEASSKVILIGDFNQNIVQESQTLFSRFLSETYPNLVNCIDNKESSTDGGTQIDICFSTSQCNLYAGYSESYFSYHKPVLCLLDYVQEIEMEEPSVVSPCEAITAVPIKSIKLQNVSTDGHRLFQLLRAGSSFEQCIDLITDLSNFVKQMPLYNGKHTNYTIFDNQFQKIPTTGDGSCFYNAISLLFTGSECLSFTLRALVSAHICFNNAYCNYLKNRVFFL
nr:PREDICTED: uncharacterized protein LOC109042086 [Bemisia tabaci]